MSVAVPAVWQAARHLPGKPHHPPVLDQVDRTLAEGRAVIDLVPAAHRPMVRCIITVDELTSAAARADRGALLRRSARPGKFAALRLLGREYLRARRLRRR